METSKSPADYKSQSRVYDLCDKCGHFRHLHQKNQSAFTTPETCHGSANCLCTLFKGRKDDTRVDEESIPQQVEEYRVYLKLIAETIDKEVPHVRQIDRDYAEEVARNIINVLEKEGWKIGRK